MRKLFFLSPVLSIKLKKFLIKLLLIFFLPVSVAAQDSVVNVLPSMFDKERDELFISLIDGWIFKQGNDTSWANKDIDTRDWKKLKPIELSPEYADKSGKVDCWFRIKIKIDSDFENESFGLKGSTWAMTDVYIDGKLVLSKGGTGDNGKTIHENNPYANLAVPVEMKAGNEYTIAMHFVDYLSPVPPHFLTSQYTGLAYVIRITGSNYNKFFLLKGVKESLTYSIIWISVCAILSLLFWFLYFQNLFEKNLMFIALCSTFITGAEICQNNMWGSAQESFTTFMINNFFFNVFGAAVCILIFILLARIFNRHISRSGRYFIAIFFIGFNTAFFLPGKFGNPVAIFLVAIVVGIGIYYILTSWKNLKGAQWAIVGGTLLTLAWGIADILSSMYPIRSSTLYIIKTGESLSFPLSLLAYVAIRFREIIIEVRVNAQQVIHLSEEKRMQALNQQKVLEEEVAKQTAELRETLHDLKSTQAQLIQSEKMASLGLLTSGIAHEIQNPLNFVNNFSELNRELIAEMKHEIDAGNLEEVKLLANDLDENEEKIANHGKRADAIVKNMLQHSRVSTGHKEPTDINTLAEEYLRLSYHGMRAKDKTFNATLNTDFDSSIGKINVVPQDMGRVLLNVFNNAFYAVNEKMKHADASYEPVVSVCTKKVDSKVEIHVKDNGTGIPQKVVDKIFQPFFTTKPTGQGTGLGLSLSYDIVKAHGGEIRVESIEGVGSEFIIHLPIN